MDDRLYVLSSVEVSMYDGNDPHTYDLMLGIYVTVEAAQAAAQEDWEEGEVNWCGRGFWDGKLYSMTLRRDGDGFGHFLTQYIITRLNRPKESEECESRQS